MTELESNRIFRNALSVEKDFYFERLWLSRLNMSQREGPRTYQLVSRDILLFALSPIWAWIVRKLLDFIWERNKTRLRLEGKTHFSRYLFAMFGDELLLFLFGWLLGTPENVEMSEFQESVQRFARLHKKYHQLVGSKPCSVCYSIYWNRMLFERMVSNFELAHRRSKLFSEYVMNI
jgi:hypothetical protein